MYKRELVPTSDGLGDRFDFGWFFRSLRTMPRRIRGSLAAWANIMNITPSRLQKVELGQTQIPSRDKLIDWTHRLPLPKADSADLLIMAGYIPELPAGFKGIRDHQLFSCALLELDGNEQYKGSIEMLHTRLAELQKP